MMNKTGKILACNTQVLKVFARGEHFHPLAFLEKQFPLNWIEKRKMALYVWITATGWLPVQSTTVKEIGNIIIAAISTHRKRIVAAARKNRDVAFQRKTILIFPAIEYHRRELMGMKRAFKKRLSWCCNPVCVCNIRMLLCDRKRTGLAYLNSVCWYNACVSSSSADPCGLQWGSSQAWQKSLCNQRWGQSPKQLNAANQNWGGNQRVWVEMKWKNEN